MFLFRDGGRDWLVQNVLLTCQVVWNQIWLLGPQFLHLYNGEVDPIVSKVLPALTSGNKKLHCVKQQTTGLSGFLPATPVGRVHFRCRVLWGASLQRLGHGPRAMGDSRAPRGLPGQVSRAAFLGRVCQASESLQGTPASGQSGQTLA